jgi:FkbM family methyltransferase
MAAANAVLAGLGGIARGARAARLGRPLAVARDACDAPFVKLGRPVLHGRIEGLAFRGHLRHRGFLATGARRESSYIGLFLDSLRPGLTVVDGGAHLGVYTVLAARAVGPDGHVLAFEPDPYNYGALAWNARRLAGGAPMLSRRALAAESGRASFHVSRGTIGSSFFPRSDTARVTTVERTTLDRELRGLDLRGGLLVKLNVEGAEGLVLDGLRETLDRADDVTLFAEVHPALLAEAGTDAAGLFAQLEALGFSIEWISRTGHSSGPLADRTLDAHGHVLAVRVSGARSGAQAGAQRARPRRQPLARAGSAPRAS